jgi:hypothetical protein
MIRINFNNGLYEEWLYNCNIYTFVNLKGFYEFVIFLNSSFQIREIKIKGKRIYHNNDNYNLLNLKYYLR